MIEPQGQKRGIKMTSLRFDPPCFVSADRTRLKQVLVDLLSNAIKYNQPSGTGLPPDMLMRLFQPLNRLGQETGIGGCV